MKINALTVLGLIINSLITIFIYTSGEYKGLDIIMITALLLSCIGIIIMKFYNVKIGSIIFSIGSFVFIPIGIIGIIGVRKIVEKIEEEKFNKENYE